MDLGLRATEALEDEEGAVLDLRRELRLEEERTHGAKGPFGLGTIDVDVERRRYDAALLPTPEVHVEAGETELRDRVEHDRLGHSEVDEGPDDHVPREPRRRVEKEDLAATGAERELVAMELAIRRVRVAVRVPRRGGVGVPMIMRVGVIVRVIVRVPRRVVMGRCMWRDVRR